MSTETRSYASVSDANANVWQKRTTATWTQDNPSVSYPTNPRVSETNVYDAGGHRRRTTVEYTSYGLPSEVREYAADAATVLRRTTTTYFWDSVYINKRIIGLPREIQVYDTNNQPVSKTWFDYDWGGDYWASLPASAVQHDGSGDHTGRGLLCWVGRWDTLDVNNFDKAQRFHFRYNRTGSLIRRSDPLWHETNISYSDSFSDNVNRNTFAYPTTVTDPDGFSTSVKYHFESGAVTRTVGPPPAGQSQGLVQAMQYDAAGRITRVTTENNGAYTRYVYGPDYLESLSSVNNVADEAYTFQLLNGRGQVFISGGNHPGSSGGYRAQVVYYDVMGRVMKQSNPTEISNVWAPAGDDAAGWVFRNQTYNWQGRPLVTTNQDGTQQYASYAGCGCAGGEVVTLTDEVGRQQKVYSDVLGRQWKTEILNWNGTVYSTTTNTFNARDQVTLVRQWAGAENGGGAYQDTTMGYDGFGRMQSKHVPEQDAGAATVYAYNADDTVQSVTDARGASATYEYNNGRHLISHISYEPAGGVPDTPDVWFAYDAAGNRTSMTDGTGSVTYGFDQLSRMTSEAKTFNGLSGSYALSYEYNLAGQLKKITDPTNITINYNQDSSGRTTAITGENNLYGGVSQYASNVAYRAWSGLKQMSYGNNPLTLQVAYNSRQLPTNYEVSGGFSIAAKQQYQYYADGRSKYSQDQVDERFDRAYQRDHVGRLTEAYSGSEARDFINNTNSGTPTGPYRQSYVQDAWSQMTSRTNRFWSGGLDQFTASYTNGRNSAWQYNADGQVAVSGNRQYTYDAAGRNIFINEAAGYGLQITQSHDGDGQVAKRIEMHQGQYGTTTETTYYLRSSVLGGAVVTELNAQGQKTKGNVYAGGQLLATQQFSAVLWKHQLPDGSSRDTATSGWLANQLQTDPLGANLGVGDPYLMYENPSYLDIGGASLYSDSGNPFDTAAGCKVNGMPLPCDIWKQLLENEALGIGDEKNDPRNVLRLIPTPGGARVRNPSTHPVARLEGLGRWENITFNISSPENLGAAINTRPSDTRPPKAKFDIERFKDCLKEFKTALGISDGRSQGYDASNGIFTGFFGSLKVPFQIRIDQTSRTLSDIRRITGNPKAMAMSDYNDSFLVYIGSDAFRNTAPVYQLAAQIHEIGNKIYQQFAASGLKQPQASMRLQKLLDDDDAGLALEECVFGGYVMKDGRVRR